MTSRPAELLRCPAPCRMDARGPAFTFFGKRSLPSRRGRRLPNWKRDLGSGLRLKIDLPGSVRTPGLDWPGDTVPASEFELWTACRLPPPREFGARVSWTFDERQAKLAAAEGLHAS